jgi:hypothetical protein
MAVGDKCGRRNGTTGRAMLDTTFGAFFVPARARHSDVKMDVSLSVSSPILLLTDDIRLLFSLVLRESRSLL